MLGINTLKRTAQRWVIQSEPRPVIGELFPVMRYRVVDGITIIDTEYARVIEIHDNPYRIRSDEPAYTVLVWSDTDQWGVDCIYTVGGRLIAVDLWYTKYYTGGVR